MSGHSKWSTIKRKKEATDAARGMLFSKLSKAISVAIATGGGANPDTNYKLKVAIDQARSSNMPKTNIERILKKAGTETKIEEVVYEGFGPGGINIMLQTATDNRNRTAQEIKKIFERGGGSLAGPGAVSHNFKPKGFFLIKKSSDVQGQMLKLIDLKVEDIEETEEGIEIYVEPGKLGETKKDIAESGFEIVEYELVQNPISLKVVADSKTAQKIVKMLNNFDNHDDVQNVYANVDIPEGVMNNKSSLK